jgi:hypothetical protein
MKTSVVRVIGLFASVLVAGTAGAQSTQAVEWKVSEGGNGHWYWVNRAPMRWSAARTSAISLGGDLSSIETRSEVLWLDATFGEVALEPGGPCHIGGRQDSGSATVSAGWRWLTGGLVNLSNFDAFAFDDWPGGGSWGVEDGQQDFLHAGGRCRYVGDINDVPWPGVAEPLGTSLVEWSADCNADGIVDYGQILRGELEDLNFNGVPDICETSISSVLPPSVPAQGGSTITIRGNGFPANPTVLIGGVPATNVVRESLTRITATSPAVLPGMKSVTVNGFTLPDGIYIRPECGSDLDQNGIVDAGDISIILLDFGQCYETPLAAPVSSEVPELLEAQPVTETRTRR